MITDQTRRELAQRDQAEVEKARAMLEAARALGIEFVPEPPVHKRSRLEGRLGARLDLLMKFPGKWAVIQKCDTAQGGANVAMSLRKAKLRPGRWEFRGSRTPPEGSKLYARYLGPDSEGPKS